MNILRLKLSASKHEKTDRFVNTTNTDMMNTSSPWNNKYVLYVCKYFKLNDNWSTFTCLARMPCVPELTQAREVCHEVKARATVQTRKYDTIVDI